MAAFVCGRMQKRSSGAVVVETGGVRAGLLPAEFFAGGLRDGFLLSLFISRSSLSIYLLVVFLEFMVEDSSTFPINSACCAT
jgi:hypothetical protein